jgi:GNAT superfamily N-acetyltransferase
MEDVARLAEVNVETWQRAYAGIVPAAYLDAFDLEAMRERWRANVEGHPGVTCLVAAVEGVVSSYAIVGAYRTQEDADPDEDTTGWAEIYAIYTHPDLQGRGAGVAVHDAAMEVLRDQGYTRAALWVLAANDASRRWYAARGWQPDGVTSQWSSSGESLDEVRLVRDLG